MKEEISDSLESLIIIITEMEILKNNPSPHKIKLLGGINK